MNLWVSATAFCTWLGWAVGSLFLKWSQLRGLITPAKSGTISGCNSVKVVGQHLTSNSVHNPNTFTAGTGPKVWCDWAWGAAHTNHFWHHPSNISGCKSVKSGKPASISQNIPQQFHGWNRTASLVWSGHKSRPLPLKTRNIHGLKIMEVSLVSLAKATV